MAEHDLTTRMGPFLDRHLLLPLLEFLQKKNIYPEEDILRGKLELLQKTNLVDFAMDIYKKLNNTEEPTPELKSQRETVIQMLKKQKTTVNPLLDFITNNEELVSRLIDEKQFTPAYLSQKHGISEEVIENLYTWAKAQFECGNYKGAFQWLTFYRMLSRNEERCFNAIWGKVAAGILLGNRWDDAFSDLQTLRDAIENRPAVPHAQLMQQRAWLIHWSLFVFFNQPDSQNDILELFMLDNRYIQAIQLLCPHVMRYLAAALIVNRKRNKQQNVKDVIHLIEQESHSYSDPITQFVKDLYVTVDFEGAQEQLRKCEAILTNDFFLVSCAEEFLENARASMFETYCRIHNVIDIAQIAVILGMGLEEAESWCVNFIRNARLNAKIDSQSNRINMTLHPPNVYQQVIGKTDDMTFRTQMIKQNLERKAYQQQRQRR